MTNTKINNFRPQIWTRHVELSRKGGTRSMSLINVSAAKREANQRNGRQSSGPKTPEGKNRSSQNATTHGCTAARMDRPLRHESPEHHAEILSGLIESWQPANAMETMLVNAIADAWIRMERSSRWETTVLDNVMETRMRIVSQNLQKKERELKEEIDGDLGAVIAMTDEKGSVMWKNVERHSTKAWRDWHKAVETLRKMQNKRMTKPKGYSESTDMGSICISGTDQTAAATPPQPLAQPESAVAESAPQTEPAGLCPPTVPDRVPQRRDEDPEPVRHHALPARPMKSQSQLRPDFGLNKALINEDESRRAFYIDALDEVAKLTEEMSYLAGEVETRSE